MTTTNVATYRRSNDYQKFLDELLDYTGTRVAKAQDALNQAESTRRVDAAIAIRAGYGKTATANRLGISRPTLDAWLRTVEGDPDELARVVEHERFIERRLGEGQI